LSSDHLLSGVNADYKKSWGGVNSTDVVYRRRQYSGLRSQVSGLPCLGLEATALTTGYTEEHGGNPGLPLRKVMEGLGSVPKFFAKT
jgi:hypothetical protein